MRRAVCRVEPQPENESIAEFGTGYLVAPDVVMTNFHVAEKFWDDQAKAGRVVLRFDYEKKASGVSVSGWGPFQAGHGVARARRSLGGGKGPALAGAL